MSFNILGDHGLDIEILILKMVRRFENGKLVERIDQTIPIDLSAISSLKIEDSLMNVGMIGAIEINNQSSILDQLGIATKSSDDLFISIAIKDKDLVEHGLEPHQAKIEFLGLIEKTVTGSANYQDNVVIFQFEEAFVAEMRHTSWDNFIRDAKLDGDEISVTNLIEAYYNEVWKKKNKLNNKSTIIAESERYLPINNLPLIASTKIRKPREESFYDVFMRALKRTNVGIVTRGHHSFSPFMKQLLPSFRFSNAKNGIRMMTFKPYFTDRHREFIEEVRVEGIEEGVSNDYSDVYTEKFTCGPLALVKGTLDPNTNWHNSIEGESITRPDVGSLRIDVWTNFIQVNGKQAEFEDGKFDISTANSELHLYAKVVQNFIKDELGLKDAGVNLPLLDAKSQTKQRVFTPGDAKNGEAAIISELYNKLKTSFVTVNEQISFSCKGAIYRTPGKFIWIERTANSKESLLEKLWFVNSVQHSIIDGQYETEIIANRVFGDNKIDAFEALETKTAEYINGSIPITARDARALMDSQEAKEAKEEAVSKYIQYLEAQAAPASPTPPINFMTDMDVDPTIDVPADLRDAAYESGGGRKQLQEDLGLTDEEMAERQKVRSAKAKEFFAERRRLRALQKK